MAHPQALATLFGHHWAVASSDPSAAVCYQTALRLWRLPLHRVPAHIVEHRGVAVTSLVQTVIDCIDRMELPEAVAVVDAALRGRRTFGERLTRQELQEASSLLRSCSCTCWDWKTATNAVLLRRKLSAAGITVQNPHHAAYSPGAARGIDHMTGIFRHA